MFLSKMVGQLENVHVGVGGLLSGLHGGRRSVGVRGRSDATTSDLRLSTTFGFVLANPRENCSQPSKMQSATAIWKRSETGIRLCSFNNGVTRSQPAERVYAMPMFCWCTALLGESFHETTHTKIKKKIESRRQTALATWQPGSGSERHSLKAARQRRLSLPAAPSREASRNARVRFIGASLFGDKFARLPVLEVITDDSHYG